MPGHDAERLGRQVGDAAEGDERRAEAAVGDRRGVGDQAQDGGQERVEAEADHDGAADGDRRAAAGRPFEKRAEREADQDGLDAGVAATARPPSGGRSANWPVSTVMLYSSMALKMVQPTGSRPKAAPWRNARPACGNGMP